MLDESQKAVVQTTVLNAVNLTTAIASKVLGYSVGDEINEKPVTNSVISNLVLANIESKFLSSKGESNAL